MALYSGTLAFAATSFQCGCIALLTIALSWSGSPWGPQLDKLMADEAVQERCENLCIACFAAAGMLGAVAYLADLPDWTFGGRCFVFLYFATALAFLAAGLVLLTPKVPSVPLFLSVVLMFLSVRMSQGRQGDVDERSTLYGRFAAFLVLSCVLLCTWFRWSQTVLTDKGLNAMLLSEFSFVRGWCPCLLGVLCFVMSLVVWMRASLTERELSLEKGKIKLPPQLQLVVIFLTASAITAWFAASVAVESVILSRLILKTAGVIFVSIFIYLADWVGHRRAVLLVERNKKLQQLRSILMTDWLKAMLMLLLIPLSPLLFLVDGLHQITRRCCGAWGLLPGRQARRWCMTEEASWVVNELSAWAWGSVLPKCMYVCVAHYCVQVGVSQGLVLFLAWFNEYIENWHFLSAASVLFVVEILLFLFPPVAGIPLYMIAGIVVIAKVKDMDYSRWCGIGIATAFALMLKLVAIALEQKAIGEPMRNSVAVKKFIGVQTPFMKAVRLILSQKGYSYAKVAVLVGGPDWPTSVITGILGLPLMEMLLGSLPVVLLIFPVMLSAGFKLSAPGSVHSSLFNSVSNLALIVATLLQGLASMSAAYYAQAVMNEYHDDFAAEEGSFCRDPQEQEVLAALEKDAQAEKDWVAQTSWEVQPWLVRQLLRLGALSASATVWIVLNPLPGQRAFGEFTITDRVSKLEGGVLGLVRPLGWASMVSLGLVLACLTSYHSWCWMATRARPQRSEDAHSRGVELVENAEDCERNERET